MAVQLGDEGREIKGFNFFFRRAKFRLSLSSRGPGKGGGVKALILMELPLKKELFCGFPSFFLSYLLSLFLSFNSFSFSIFLSS